MQSKNEKDEIIISVRFTRVLGYIAGQYKFLLLGVFIGGFLSLMQIGFNNTYNLKAFIPYQFSNDGFRIQTLKFSTLIKEMKLDGIPGFDKSLIVDKFSSPDWWSKSVSPVFQISKSDIKDAAGVFDGQTSPIIGFEFAVNGSSAEDLTNFYRSAVIFFVNASCALGTMDYIERANSEFIEAELNKAKLIAKIAEQFKVNKKLLENLSSINSISQNPAPVFIIGDPENSSRFLPISVQISALKAKEYQLSADLSIATYKYDESMVRKKYLSNFLGHKQANLIACKDLNSAIQKIDADLSNQLGDLPLNHIRYLTKLELESKVINSRKMENNAKLLNLNVTKSKTAAAIFGSILGFFLALIVLVVIYFYKVYKENHEATL